MTTEKAGTAAATRARSASSTATPNGVDESWRKTANTPLRPAARIAGVSAATLYNLHHKGQLELRRIGGVTVVPTVALATLVDGAEKWTPSRAGEAARKARAERARANSEGAANA